MNKLSLRTKGLILIVIISLIPLLIAGAGNYSAAKQAMIQSEMEKSSSKQSIRANYIAAWMAIRKAEVLVMSRTDVVRFGRNEERLDYFERELVRSGFTYHSIGYINEQGMAIRSDGGMRSMYYESFFQAAIKGQITITDPYIPIFSPRRQSLIVVPVYGSSSVAEVTGVLYASLPVAELNAYLDFAEEGSIIRLYNDVGGIIYESDKVLLPNASLNDHNSILEPVSEQLLSSHSGVVHVRGDGEDFVVFHTKVDDTPWRLSLQEPMSKMEALVKPIFWRIASMIALSEAIIVIFFYIYFERIVKRLVRILSVTEQAADGSFQAEKLDVAQEDEIGKLANSVNGMMEHLQEMFDRLTAIINQHQYGFIVLDDQYRVTYMNKAAEDMYGYEAEDVVGQATPLLFIDHDEIREEAERLTEQLGRKIEPGLAVFKEMRNDKFSYEREWTFIHKDGTRIPTLLSSSGLRDRHGKFSGVVGMMRDHSDRKHVEKARNRLLDIVESAKDLIASVDQDGNLIYMNRAGMEMLGLADIHDEGHRVDAYVDPQMYEQLLEGAQQAREHGFWESDAQLLTLNGESLHVSMVVVAHQDIDTGELFFSSIARDISEQKHVQEKLVQATLEAEEANKAKSHFLALMSHEIRTPLNGIIGLTQLMHKTDLSAVQKDYMNKMEISSKSLLHIINDVLDFSKIEAGKIEVEKLPFHPDELLYRLTNQLSVFMGGKEQFEFIVDTPESLPYMLLGDSMRLEQVLLNLCMNAIKFTHKGHVKLKMEVCEDANEQVRISFQISDTGIGMSKELQQKLFKPFMQADRSTTRKYGGTGLGLVISMGLVELMGGKLQVTSEEHKGSQFSFTLAFGVDQSAGSSYDELSDYEADQSVWIVEDDEQMREHWCSIAASAGLAAIDFHSWQTVIDRLRRTGEGALPQLIILDMEMSDMYGVETWLSLHREAVAAGVKLIVLTTSYGRDEMLQLPILERPAAILLKPVTRMSMLRALNKVLKEERVKDLPSENRSQIAASIESVALEEAEAPADAEMLSHVRILLAEDNKINQLVAIEMLKEKGYEVGLAETGQEALQKLTEENWDLILMDIHMPVMDGTDAVRLIRSRPEYDAIPIIAVTANVVQKDHEQYMKLGMNDVITKPVTAELLHEIIAYWLKQANKTRMASAAERGSVERTDRTQLGSPAHNSAAAIPSISGMDVESVLERVNGKLPIFLHMLEQFKLDYTPFMDKLHMALKQSDFTEAARMLHTLKGAAGYLSVHSLAEAASVLERIVMNKPDSNERRPATMLLEAEMDRLLIELAKLEK